MKHYIADILPRLAKFSAKLDQTTLLIDKPWFKMGEEEISEKFIFRRNGTLLYSSEGNVNDGSWEYLPEANALILNYDFVKKMYRHQYLDNALLVLKLDTHKSDPSAYLILANENEIPSLDVDAYISHRLSQAFKPYNNKLLGSSDLFYYTDDNVRLKLSNGDQFILDYPKSRKDGVDTHFKNYLGCRVLLNGDLAPSGKFLSSNKVYAYYIDNSRIIDIKELIFVSDGLTIEKRPAQNISIGDLVFVKNTPAENGIYRVSWTLEVIVTDGTISEILNV